MKRWLLKQKFVMDMGFQVWPLINFTLLVVAASDKLTKVTGIEHVSVLLAVLLPSAFAGVWLVGFVMDRYKYTQGMQDEQAKRSPTWGKSVEYFEEILAELRKREAK